MSEREEMLTVEQVKAEVARIDAMKGDDEAAHDSEDALHVSVLEAIAIGHPDPMAIAQAALETQAIKFCRWCA